MSLLNKYDQYLKNQLSEEESATITKNIVKTYFEEEALKTKWKQILDKEETLQEFKKKTITPQRGIRKLFQTVGTIAASLLVLFATWFAYQQASTPTYIKLAENYLSEPFQPYGVRKGGGEEALRLKAIQYFRVEDFASSASTIEQYIPSSTNIEDYLLLGVSYLKLQNWEGAITYLNKVLSHTNGTFKNEANWFLSLAYILSNDLNAATETLEKLVLKQGWKKEEAKRLLNVIKAN